MSNETLHIKGLVSMIQKIIGMTQKVQVWMHKKGAWTVGDVII